MREGRLQLEEQDKLSELRNAICVRLGEYRAKHVLSTEEEAAKLAAVYLPEKTEKVRISALLHDITKEYDAKRQLQIFSEFGIIVDNVMLASPKVFHAKTAALLIPREFPEYADPEIVSAVYKHTTGCADMTLMDMLIYLADYIEPTRKFADCQVLRSCFWDGLAKTQTEPERLLHLYRTMVLSFDLTIKNLIEEQSVIAPDTIAARNVFVLKCKNISEEGK